MSDIRRAVGRMRAEGFAVAVIADALTIAPNTVRYHLRRLDDAAAGDREARPVSVQELAGARREIGTRDAVANLLDEGVTRAEVARRLGISKSTVSYHARRLGFAVDARCARRYDWRVVQAYYDEGHSVAECAAQFGFSTESWHAAMKRGDIVTRPRGIDDATLFSAGVRRGRGTVKRRLLAGGYVAPECAQCGLDTWRGRRLGLELHHRNGDGRDNRLQNLELLCPNCHSQTENFAGRGARGRGRAVDPAG